MALDNNLVVGKGKLYFDLYPVGTKVGTGEVYFGNTPELSTSSSATTLDHYDSDEGLNVKDQSITVQNDSTGKFITDNISLENQGLWFGGEIEKTTLTAVTGATETKAAKRGSFVQLGASVDMPTGARNITNLVVKIGATTVPALNNYDVDLDLGRVYIEDAAPGIDDGDALIYTYDIAAGVRSVVVGKGTEVRGALRFISANPVGSQKDFYWPYVKLTSDGDFSLKGSEWQQIPFSFEVLKKDSVTERVYIDDRTVA